MEGKTFREQLIRRQGNTLGREFADRLGISESYWSLIRRGERPLSLTVIERAIQEFPDLAPFFVQDLLPVPAERGRAEAAHTHSGRWRRDMRRLLVNGAVAVLLALSGFTAVSGTFADSTSTSFAAGAPTKPTSTATPTNAPATATATPRTPSAGATATPTATSTTQTGSTSAATSQVVVTSITATCTGPDTATMIVTINFSAPYTGTITFFVEGHSTTDGKWHTVNSSISSITSSTGTTSFSGNTITFTDSTSATFTITYTGSADFNSYRVAIGRVRDGPRTTLGGLNTKSNSIDCGFKKPKSKPSALGTSLLGQLWLTATGRETL